MGYFMDGFKKLPKMKTGGSVKKMADGRLAGSLSYKDLKEVPAVEMPTGSGRRGIRIDGQEVPAVEMPMGKPLRRLKGLKRGGKVKK